MIIHKHGEMSYFSQLDLQKVFERALRRASLPLYFTQGFNPRVKMSFGNALKVGIDGEMETTFYFTEQLTPEHVKEKLVPQLPQGLEIVTVEDGKDTRIHDA
jgi:radical SAM-linked protein